jgi:hypothetical protein
MLAVSVNKTMKSSSQFASAQTPLAASAPIPHQLCRVRDPREDERPELRRVDPAPNPPARNRSDDALDERPCTLGAPQGSGDERGRYDGPCGEDDRAERNCAGLPADDRKYRTDRQQ